MHENPNHLTGQVAIWGAGTANEWSVRRMEPGDVVLFYVGDRTYHAATMIDTEENPDLDETLWEPYADRSQDDPRDSRPLIAYRDDVSDALNAAHSMPANDAFVTSVPFRYFRTISWG